MKRQYIPMEMSDFVNIELRRSNPILTFYLDELPVQGFTQIVAILRVTQFALGGLCLYLGAEYILNLLVMGIQDFLFLIVKTFA